MTSGTGMNKLYSLGYYIRIFHDVHTMTTSPTDTFSKYFLVRLIGLFIERNDVIYA